MWKITIEEYRKLLSKIHTEEKIPLFLRAKEEKGQVVPKTMANAKTATSGTTNSHTEPLIGGHETGGTKGTTTGRHNRTTTRPKSRLKSFSNSPESTESPIPKKR